jgi:hypothetical protein
LWQRKKEDLKEHGFSRKDALRRRKNRGDKETEETVVADTYAKIQAKEAEAAEHSSEK